MSPAPLVYVNYGRPEDYDELDALGISVRGAIVIARYGGSFRGTKPKIAAEHGAIGCLIYSDPRDDGYFAGRGVSRRPDAQQGWRPARQRDGPADLLGRSADAGCRGRAWREAARDQRGGRRITKIPVLPISYGDAQPLLAAMSGPIAPAAWRGALPITYRLGPGPGAGASEGLVQLGHEAALQRHRDASPARRFPTSGSCAATITTRG